MGAWFSLDGVVCEDVGIHVKVYPPRVVPRRRSNSAPVPGGEPARMWDGAYGYDRMMLPVEIYIDGGAAPEVVAAFLQPEERDIVFGDDPAFRLRGCLDDQVDLEKVMRGRLPRTATLNFVCSPFKVLDMPGALTEITEFSSIEHLGSARSFPVFRIWGEGEGEVVLRSRDSFRVRNLTNDEPLIVDSGAMICLNAAGTINRSFDMSGDYPILEPGENSISFYGGIEKIEIEPNFAWLGR